MTHIAGTPIDLSGLMAQLAMDRPAFHSEADFQHTFAWAICTADPRLRARLEIQLPANEHLDLLLTNANTDQKTAIEFKYPRASWTWNSQSEAFNLRAHGATDLVGYDTLKDLQRLESLVDAGTVQNGMLIMLTNEPAYWKKPASTLPTNADAFRINDGITISGTRDWGPKTGDGTKRGRARPIELRGSYDITWQDYAELPGSKGRFRWFAIEVNH